MEEKINKCTALKSFRKGKGNKTFSFIEGREYTVVKTSLFYYYIIGENGIFHIHKKSFYKQFSVYHPNYSKAHGRIATPFEVDLRQQITFIENLLTSKNKKYGDAALNPVKAFSKLDAIERINARLDEKIARVINKQEDDEEDTELDIIGILILKRIAKKRLADAKK